MQRSLLQVLLHRTATGMPQGCASVAGGTLTHVCQEAADGPINFVPQLVAHFLQRSSQGWSDTAARLVPGRRRSCVSLSHIGSDTDSRTDKRCMPGSGKYPHRSILSMPSAAASQGLAPGQIFFLKRESSKGVVGGLSFDWTSILFGPALYPFNLGSPGGSGIL